MAAVAIASLGLAACSGGGDDAAAKKTTTTTTRPATTTTAPAPPKAPLTGLDDPSGQSITRPAVSVKVENTEFARPQAGLDQADVVYEEVVEGNITRLVAMFNSQIPDVIGPVRSVRAIDPDIVWPLGGIFTFSGGAAVNVDAASAAPVTIVTENNQDVLVRNAQGQPPRDAPHNLYALGPQLFGVGGQPVPPPSLFQYYLKGAPPAAAQGVLSFRVGFTPGYDPTYVWDAGAGVWRRSMNGAPHTASNGNQLSPTNVVVQFTEYPGEADGVTVGEGDVWVFSDGTVRMGRWVRPDHTQPAHYVDANGTPILLRPGTTWVELLPVGSPVDLELAPPPPETTAPPATVPPTTTKPKKK
ncbi:MAG TPA: DUF3048 domain-containing protein [Acidimicrobiia bacterium]|nr:DUF3048 domain-containing protein [Acidimicrobiia bacterium]